MSSYAEELLHRFSKKGLLIDTNLLLLYIVGAYDEDIVKRSAFKRVDAYEFQDLRLLRGLVSLFATCVTTPYVLSEVSNFIKQLPSVQAQACLLRFREVIHGFVELQVKSADVAGHPRFHFLGLTDTSMAQVASEYLVLTDDARFVFHLNELELDALNINHLRQELWLQQ